MPDKSQTHDQVAAEVRVIIARRLARIIKNQAVMDARLIVIESKVGTIWGARTRLAQLFWAVLTAAAIWATINYLESKHETENRQLMQLIQQARAK